MARAGAGEPPEAPTGALPERGGPGACPSCRTRFPTGFALRKHTYQGCPGLR